MNVSGGLVLMIALALLVLVGLNAVGGAYEDTGINESDDAYQSMEGSKEVVSPLFRVFGYSILGIGAFVTLRAFKLV
ncbi:hypothetical protein SAMN04488589_0616 [Methanolobus vulcani]|uniref:Uncharacterized protein n=1 Tax=Methanolobus vulcani TaxID=38026 RepID=A0A7Z7FDM4_9EURY|nr:hypothetical protein [Methanolobus vulcani]SDF46925.1 hypothetical protein SAMN04488589_0616 [Methanolobus vulcani]